MASLALKMVTLVWWGFTLNMTMNNLGGYIGGEILTPKISLILTYFGCFLSICRPRDPYFNPGGPTLLFMVSTILEKKIGQNDMSHAMAIPNINDVEVIFRIGPRAGPFDAFSHISRKFQYRVLSTYIFLNFSHHSESNDMQQPYVLINGLGVRGPLSV